MLSLEQVLDELPETADEIAEFLLGRNCVGHRRDGRSCPMAVLLGKEGFIRPFVQQEFVEAEGVDAYPPTPAALSSFIERFDDGEYPQLEIDEAAS